MKLPIERMTMTRMLWAWLVIAMLAASPGARAQAEATPFKPEELEALVAPIALYPDSVLSQALMASTYPLEIVQAARWLKANPTLKGEAAVKAVANQSWDVSVKSLVAFPQVLEPMNDQLDWTKKLGDAVLAQQKDVLAAVQRLRGKAQDSGNLKTTEQQTVVVEQAETKIVRIEPTNPQVIYVPAYEPAVVYGGWGYPAYPPYYWPPYPAYYPGYAFGAGLAWGLGFAAAGAIFGNCNWGGGDIDINVNRATNIDRNFDRNKGGKGSMTPAIAGRFLPRQRHPREVRQERGRRRPTQRLPWSRRGGRSCRRRRSPGRRRPGGRGRPGRSRRPGLGRRSWRCRRSRRIGGPRRPRRWRSRQRLQRREPRRRRRPAKRRPRPRQHAGLEPWRRHARRRWSRRRWWRSRASLRRTGMNAARTRFRIRTVLQAAVLAGTLVVAVVPAHAASPRHAFETPEAAMTAFGDAVAINDEAALKGMLGADYHEFIPPVGADIRYAFLELWAQARAIKLVGDKQARVTVGKEGWTLPIPLVKAGTAWPFDTIAGAEEMRIRRVGRNELAVMQTLLAIRDAQLEYVATDHDGDRVLQYAPKLSSSPGKRDGLYWPTRADEPQSPIGPALASAGLGSSAGYHGYRYKLLTEQGKNAPGGALSYIAKGRLFGGFAVIAWPVSYLDSGVKTFMISHDVQIYERDLGPDTAARAAATKAFDPGPGWSKVSP